MLIPLSAVGLTLLAVVLAVRAGMRWGSTAAERAETLVGDEWLRRGPPVRVRMTRAITVRAGAASAWRWLAQVGRGAGWYSWDLLDNGSRRSARHLVSWIPEPALGDATSVGYLRALGPGREIAWWFEGRFAGAAARAAYVYRLRPCPEGARLLMRVSADASGLMAFLALRVTLPLIDSIMAIRQLRRLAASIETYGSRGSDPEAPETGAGDQFQLYHVIYASGAEAGIAGNQGAREMRQAALAAGVVREAGKRAD